MHTTVAEGLVFHYMENTGTISLWSNGKRVRRYNLRNSNGGGSRQFFKVGSYFVKAEYIDEDSFGQCSEEADVAREINPKDQKYFSKLLFCSDFVPESVRWTMFPWYNLRACSDPNLIQSGIAIVRRLCDKYDIADVVPNVNINWFIHNGRPLIVDCGIRR
jgi:hypothetical protein